MTADKALQVHRRYGWQLLLVCANINNRGSAELYKFSQPVFHG
jgi:hypothetical protein